jgi:hypothetical protein
MVKSSQFRFHRGRDRDANLVAGVIVRAFASTALLFAGLALGSCSSFPAYVSDHWPTWAGGLPSDVPPRPGAPGYEEFISHQQTRDAVAPAAAPAQAGTPAPTPVAATAPAAPPAAAVDAQPASPGMRRTDDQGAVQGGLY